MPKTTQAPGEFTRLPLARLKESPLNPRKTFDAAALAELAASVKEHGVLTPLLVRPLDGKAGAYQIIAGARRFRAAKAAKVRDVPVRVLKIDDAAALELMVIENLQRADVTAIEEAAGYRQLIEKHGFTAETIAARVGKSKAYVYARLKLLECAPKVVAALSEGKLPESHALELSRLKSADQEALIRDRWGVFREGEAVPIRELRAKIQGQIVARELEDQVAAADNAAGAEVALLSRSYVNVPDALKKRERVDSYDVRTFPKPRPKARPAMWADAPHRGKLVWVLPNAGDANEDRREHAYAARQKSETAAREKRAAIARRGRAAALAAILEKVAGRPDRKRLAAICAGLWHELRYETSKAVAQLVGWEKPVQAYETRGHSWITRQVEALAEGRLWRLLVAMSVAEETQVTSWGVGRADRLEALGRAYGVNVKACGARAARELAAEAAAKKKAKKASGQRRASVRTSARKGKR